MKAWPDWDEFVRRLREDAAFREEVRRQVLTEDLLNLPAVVQAGLAALAEWMERAEAQIQENSRQIATLTEQVRENSRQIAALTEALREFREAAERRFAAAEAQIAENSRQIAALAEQVRENGVRMGRLEERWGLVHEDIAGELMPRFLEEKGHRVIRRVPMAFDGEVDLVMEVEVRGATRTLAVEVKGRVYGRGPFEGILRKVGDPRFRERLLREGFSGHIVPAVFGLRVYSGAAETAGELRVGLYDAGRGTVVEPDWGVP